VKRYIASADFRPARGTESLLAKYKYSLALLSQRKAVQEWLRGRTREVREAEWASGVKREGEEVMRETVVQGGKEGRKRGETVVPQFDFEGIDLGSAGKTVQGGKVESEAFFSRQQTGEGEVTAEQTRPIESELIGDESGRGGVIAKEQTRSESVQIDGEELQAGEESGEATAIAGERTQIESQHIDGEKQIRKESGEAASVAGKANNEIRNESEREVEP
jgi:hypothetical protein